MSNFNLREEFNKLEIKILLFKKKMFLKFLNNVFMIFTNKFHKSD